MEKPRTITMRTVPRRLSLEQSIRRACDLVWPTSFVPRLVLQSTPTAIMGLSIIVFTLFWIVMVVHGGHNNWDRGQIVAPLATHNVLIAALAGLWIIPPGLYLLFGRYEPGQGRREPSTP